MSTLKSFNRILEAMFRDVVTKTSLEDLEAGSAIKAFIDSDLTIQKTMREVKLITFLSKLDNRFKKYLVQK